MTVGKWHWPRRGKIAVQLFVAIQIALTVYMNIVEKQAGAMFDARMADAKEAGALAELGVSFFGSLGLASVGLGVLPYWAVASVVLLVVAVIYHPRKLQP